jgi:hypothetical protein
MIVGSAEYSVPRYISVDLAHAVSREQVNSYLNLAPVVAMYTASA